MVARGGINISDIGKVTYGRSEGKGYKSCTLDIIGSRSFMKIYCSCGRIVGLDRNEMQIKKSLGKELECAVCRNSRIASDIDELNARFDGTYVEDEEGSF